MEILTAKENNLPILFVVLNNARLGMVYHGHSLQFQRVHPSFEQEMINISAIAAAMNIPSVRVNGLEEIDQEVINSLMNLNGPALLEVALVDNNVPPMGDRVKFLSSFGK
jgi:acetolactate synthase-1/2/3 large subunit